MQLIKYNPHDLEIFHTTSGKECYHILINQAIETFSIRCSLSDKWSSYDNAVAELLLECIKTKFVYVRV